MIERFFGNIQAGSEQITISVLLRSSIDSSEITGRRARDINAFYYRQGGLPVTINTFDLASVDVAWSANGWIEIDSANQKGLYRLDLPDAAVAIGSDWVIICVVTSGAFRFYERYNLRNPVQSLRMTEAIILDNSYISLANAEIYFSTRLNSDAWDSASDLDKTKALITATRAIDRLNFAGQQSYPNQLLQFPRGNFIDDTTINLQNFTGLLSDVLNSVPPKKFVSDTDIPQDIQIACCEIAIELLDGADPNTDILNLSAIGQTFTTARTTYQRDFVPEHIRAGIPSAIAWGYLRPYLRDPQEMKLTRIR